MAGQPSGVIEAVTTMSSSKTYSLDDFANYALERASIDYEGKTFKYFDSKEDVLSLFDNAHFEERNIRIHEDTGDVFQAKVLRIGSWRRHGEEQLWAARIDNRITYCHGQEGEALSILPGASVNLFDAEHTQHYHADTEPFCFISPATIPKAGEYLDLLVEIMYLRQGLIDALLDNKKGFLLSWVKNVCVRLRDGYKHKQSHFRTAAAPATGSTPTIPSTSTNSLLPMSLWTSDQHLAARQAISSYSEQFEKENTFLKAQLADALSRNNAMNAEMEQQKRTIEQVTEAKTKVVADAELKNEAMGAEISRQKQRIEELHKEKIKVVADAQSQNEALIVQQQRKIDELLKEKTKAVADAQTEKSAMDTEIKKQKRKIEELSEEKEEAEKRVKNIVQMYKDGSRAAEEYGAARKE